MYAIRKGVAVLLVATVLLASAGPARAEFIRLDFFDPENASNIDIDISVDFYYDAASNDAATITTYIRNDSNNSTSGTNVSITGFAFNAPEDDSGSGYLELAENGFIDLLSDPQGSSVEHFIIRWQDATGDESGKILIDGDGTVIPKPASILLFGTAMTGGVAAAIRKRKKR